MYVREALKNIENYKNRNTKVKKYVDLGMGMQNYECGHLVNADNKAAAVSSRSLGR